MDEELYFIDARNDVRDHRVVRPTTTAVVPARAVAVAPAAAAPAAAYVRTAPAAYAAAPAAFPTAYPAAPFIGATSPVYASSPFYGQPYGPWTGQLGGLLGGLGVGGLGGLNLGDIVKLGVDAWAAFKALPPAPTPTGDVATDLANMDVHMSALARDAQGRKQLEYVGELAGRFGRGFFGAW